VAVPLPANVGASLELEALFEPGTASEIGLLLEFGDRQATIGYDAREGRLFVDRRRSGPSFHDEFLGRHEVPVSLSNGTLDVRVFLDRSSVEVFASDGTRVISDLIFPGEDLTGIDAYARNGSAELANLRAWRLREITR
jgi:sucrose-6-phosphate hydrolase SacC (GH32 family)